MCHLLSMFLQFARSFLPFHCDVMSSFYFWQRDRMWLLHAPDLLASSSSSFSVALLCSTMFFRMLFFFFALKEDTFHRSRCCTTKTVQTFYDFNKSIGKFQIIQTISFKSVKLKERHWLHYGSLCYYYCYFTLFFSRTLFALCISPLLSFLFSSWYFTFNRRADVCVLRALKINGTRIYTTATDLNAMFFFSFSSSFCVVVLLLPLLLLILFFCFVRVSIHSLLLPFSSWILASFHAL